MKIFCRYKKLSMYESPAPVIEFNATFAGGALGHSNVSDDDNVQDKLSTGRSPAAGWTPTPTPATLSTGEWGQRSGGVCVMLTLSRSLAKKSSNLHEETEDFLGLPYIEVWDTEWRDTFYVCCLHPITRQIQFIVSQTSVLFWFCASHKEFILL